MKFFEHKPFDAKAVIGFGILNGISIGLLNLSLGFNSVGFYQVELILRNILYLACSIVGPLHVPFIKRICFSTSVLLFMYSR